MSNRCSQTAAYAFGTSVDRRRRATASGTWRIYAAAGVLCVLAPLAPAASAAPPPTTIDLDLQPTRAGGRDQSQSPYFLVTSSDRTGDRLPLKFTHGEVDIVGVIASVKVNQVYTNESSRPLEAIYVFPGSTRAAVHGLRMTIGDRIIQARIAERGQARQAYRQAVEQGITAALLEQERPNVMRMSVGNIPPNATVNVELSYSELLLPTEQRYEFVFPTVVGPRYGSAPEVGATGGESAGFDLALRIASAVPVTSLRCNHEVTVGADDPRHVEVYVTPDRARHADFVLRYGLAGDEITSGLMLYPGRDENFFLFMIEPPERVAPEQVLPREYVFVVDVSGSMRGTPITTSKQVMRHLLAQLRPDERFNLVLFSNSHQQLAPTSVPASRAWIERAFGWIDEQAGGGGTELLPALRSAFAIPDAGLARSVVVLSDGLVSFEAETFALVREQRGRANLFAFGIGTSVNRFLIEGLARAGSGEPFVVEGAAQAPAEVERFCGYVAAPLLTGIALSYDGFDAYDVAPAQIPDLFAQRPIAIFGKYRGSASGTIRLVGSGAGHPVRGEFEVAAGLASPRHAALQSLWARQRVAELADDATGDRRDDHQAEVLSLGLRYNLLTRYTSFVADAASNGVDRSDEYAREYLPRAEALADSSPIVFYAPESAPPVSGAVVPMLGKGPTNRIQVGGSGGGVSTKGLATILREGGGGAQYKVSGATVRGQLVEASRASRMRGTGYLDRAEIQRVVTRGVGQIQFCYEKELLKHPSLSGRLVVEWTIDAQGNVTLVKVASSTIESAVVARCIVSAIKGWRFPPPRGGEVTVTYPFIFNALGF